MGVPEWILAGLVGGIVGLILCLPVILWILWDLMRPRLVKVSGTPIRAYGNLGQARGKTIRTPKWKRVLNYMIWWN